MSAINIQTTTNFQENILNSDIFLPFELITPSEKEGMSRNDENKLRCFVIEIIQEAGILLKLPQNCILTGMLIYNRFYYKQSYQNFEPLSIATSSLFIATKVEEVFRKIRDLISVFYFIVKKKENTENKILDVTSDLYQQLKANVITMEHYILKELGFDFYKLNTHPHNFLIHFLKLLKGNSNLIQKVLIYFINYNNIRESNICFFNIYHYSLGIILMMLIEQLVECVFLQMLLLVLLFI